LRTGDVVDAAGVSQRHGGEVVVHHRERLKVGGGGNLVGSWGELDGVLKICRRTSGEQRRLLLAWKPVEGCRGRWQRSRLLVVPGR